MKWSILNTHHATSEIDLMLIEESLATAYAKRHQTATKKAFARGR
jgi:hypothetical protein